MWVCFDISMIEGESIMHVNLVFILEMINKRWNVTHNGALRSSIGTIVWTISTILLMFKLCIVRENIITP
jgi:hypothetical protein